MKGLLIKDLKLINNNGKNLLLVFLIIGTMMGIMTKELYAAVGYVTFIFTLFMVSTISYDEYDNGYPFLFTLPITRRQYVNEKYVFVLIMTAISFLVGIISVVVQFFLLTPKESLTELILMYGVYTITVLILNDIMIPLKLRFESEKGRLVIPIVFGGAMVIALIAAKLAGMLSETLKEKFLLAAFNIGEYGIAAIVIVAAVIVTIASWFWSQRILEKKEF